MTPAYLVLEDGRYFRGMRFGATSDAAGEAVFNTALSGYQEILGDPSYARQIVVMTYPMMGNYGIAPEDFEAARPYLSALIVKEPSRIASNWRHDRSLHAYLEAEGIPGLCDIDTRALVRHLRDKGAMQAVIAGTDNKIESLVERARRQPSMNGCDLASDVTSVEPYSWREGSPALSSLGVAPKKEFNVVVYDYGVKRNILRRLVDVGCNVTVVPAQTSAEDVLAMRPDGVMLSNGPGDPQAVTYAIDNIRRLFGKVPIFGICLGHQMLCLAAGAKSYKLKFGHHGANHPVKDLTTGRVEITSQNHGFAIDPATLPADAEMTHINLNDQTLSGVRFKSVPAFSVQYHPEAAPGPRDAAYLFNRFVELMRQWGETRSQGAV